MYDEPGHVDALGKHRTNRKGILRLRRLVFASTKDQDKSGEGPHALQPRGRNDRATPGTYFAAQAGTQYGQPRTLRDWPMNSLAKPAT